MKTPLLFLALLLIVLPLAICACDNNSNLPPKTAEELVATSKWILETDIGTFYSDHKSKLYDGKRLYITDAAWDKHNGEDIVYLSGKTKVIVSDVLAYERSKIK
jgi:hypothetical protein